MVFLTRDQTYVSCGSRIDKQILYHWITWEDPDCKFRLNLSGKAWFSDSLILLLGPVYLPGHVFMVIKDAQAWGSPSVETI